MRASLLPCAAIVCVAASFAGLDTARAQCQTWIPAHSALGANFPALAFTVFDDGQGAALYAGGYFTRAGSAVASHVARWDGSDWSELGAGTDATVHALAVFDDGSGPALYAGGDFTTAGGTFASHVARWDGSSWTALGSGVDARVYALATFDDGSGTALYAGGDFTVAGGIAASHVARWDGSTWTPLASGADESVRALAVFDDGSGPRLHAGGVFTTAGGNAASHLAAWNGSAWSALGSGVDDYVFALATFDDGGGTELYAGGRFTNAGGAPAAHVARWDGTAWSPLGAGHNADVYAFATFDDGAGPDLYAGGDFTSSGVHVARWDGLAWSSIGVVTSTVHALGVFQEASGAALFLGGSFSSAQDVESPCIVKWTAAGWAGVGAGFDDHVNALAVFDDGSGRALYAGGKFDSAGAEHAEQVARWNGSHWTPVGSGIGGSAPNVRAMIVFDDGSGPALYAGGHFSIASGGIADRIARWDGASWSPVGGGTNGDVISLAVFDDGTGPALYAGGSFTIAGGVPAAKVARWNGTSWAALGSGLGGGSQPNAFALTVFDDGTGTRLYAGGNFTTAGGITANGIASWDGTTWSGLGASMPNTVRALTTFDDGSGTALYVGGSLTSVPAGSTNIARWNGSAWLPVGGGIADGDVLAFAAYDDGSGTGPALHAGGHFLTAGGLQVNHIASWDGSAWAPLGNGTSSWVTSLGVFDDGQGGGPDLFAGGLFNLLDSPPAGYLGQWRGCGRPGVPTCAGDGIQAPCPCVDGAPGRGCENSAGTGGALLTSSGWTSLAFDSSRLTSSGELPSAFSIFLQGDAQVMPTPFGDGLRCAGGNLKRLFLASASAGVVSAPGIGDPSISARSAALGDPLEPGDVRVYQVYYRDPNPTFCPGPLGNTWNVSSGLRIGWLP